MTAAEALATVGSVSAIIQVVDFSSKCISKGIELYRSNDGNSHQNAAIELAANHLTTLNAEVEAEADHLNDVELRNLCGAATSASSDLLGALVRVRGDGTAWKTPWAAIRSVWSNQEILDLEHRLSSIRSELNLHITTRTRCTTEAQRQIVEAILQSRDVFETHLQDQRVLIRNVSEEIKGAIENSHETTLDEFRQIVAGSELANLNGHDQTRQKLRITAERISRMSQTNNDATAQQIESAESEIVDVVNRVSDISQAEHNQTQRQVAELRQALQELTDQMASRNQELKEVLEAYQATKNKKSKQQLFDRTKVLTAAIMALETMYRSLKAILVVLQDRTKELLETVQSSELWAITHCAQRFVSSSQTRDDSLRRPIELGAWKVASSGSESAASDSYAAHDVYFKYFYKGAQYRSVHVDANAMENRWKFHSEHSSASRSHVEGFVVDDTPCTSKCLWLLGSLALALETHLTSEDAAFVVLSETFDKIFDTMSPRSFSDGSRTPRLRSDIEYWISFAKSRGMQIDMGKETFDYESLENKQKQDLSHVLASLLSGVDPSKHLVLPSWLFRTGNGPIKPIIKSLGDVGLPFTIDEISAFELYIHFGPPTLTSGPPQTITARAPPPEPRETVLLVFDE